MITTVSGTNGVWYQVGKLLYGSEGYLHLSSKSTEFKGLVTDRLGSITKLPLETPGLIRVSDVGVSQKLIGDLASEIFSELGSLSDYTKVDDGFELIPDIYLSQCYQFQGMFINKLNIFQVLDINSSQESKLEYYLAHPELLPNNGIKLDIVSKFNLNWKPIKYVTPSELTYRVRYAEYNQFGDRVGIGFIEGPCSKLVIEVPNNGSNIRTITHLVFKYTPNE